MYVNGTGVASSMIFHISKIAQHALKGIYSKTRKGLNNVGLVSTNLQFNQSLSGVDWMIKLSLTQLFSLMCLIPDES